MNEIPLALYMFMCAVSIALIVFSLIERENFVRIITSFIAMVLSYVNASVILNGNVVLIQTDGVTHSYIPVMIPALNYFWLFLALLSALLVVLFIADLINLSLQSELDEKQSDAEQEY